MADLSINTAAVISSNVAFPIYNRTAGVEITAGKFVYLDDSNIWQLVDADSNVGTETSRTYGIALNHGYAGQVITVATGDTDFTPGATLVTGTTYVGSTNAGNIAPSTDLTTGDYPVVVGIAKSTTKLNLKPAAAGAAI